MTAKCRPYDLLDGYETLSIELKLALVAEARQTFGVREARQLWSALALPKGESQPYVDGRSRRARELPLLKRFLDEQCRLDPAAEIGASQLFAAYQRWAADERFRPVTLTLFGRLMGDLGIAKLQRSTIYYIGLRLGDEEKGS